MVAARLATYALLVLAPLTAFAPLGPPIAWGVFPLYVQAVVELSDAAVLALLAAVALLPARERRAVPRPVAAPLIRALFLLAALGLVTSPFALYPPLAAYSALRWLLAAGAAWALARSRASRRAMATTLAVGLLPHVAVGVGQALVQSPLGLPVERALPVSHPAASIVATGGAAWLRAYGLTFHPNVLGGFLCVAILLVLPFLDRPVLRLMWWLLWIGLFLTFSRSAWLAAVTALAVAATWMARHRPPFRRPLAGALAGVGVILFLGAALCAPQLAARFSPVTAPLGAAGSPPAERLSLEGRAEMARAALASIRERPLTGVGAGNFPLEMLRRRTRSAPQYVHNVPLLLAAEVGVTGGLVWIAAWLAGFVALAAGWRRATAETVTGLSAWCAIGLIGVFDSYPWSLHSGRLLTAITLGAVGARGDADE